MFLLIISIKVPIDLRYFSQKKNNRFDDDEIIHISGFFLSLTPFFLPESELYRMRVFTPKCHIFFHNDL